MWASSRNSESSAVPPTCRDCAAAGASFCWNEKRKMSHEIIIKEIALNYPTQEVGNCEIKSERKLDFSRRQQSIAANSGKSMQTKHKSYHCAHFLRELTNYVGECESMTREQKFMFFTCTMLLCSQTISMAIMQGIKELELCNSASMTFKYELTLLFIEFSLSVKSNDHTGEFTRIN